LMAFIRMILERKDLLPKIISVIILFWTAFSNEFIQSKVELTGAVSF
jgi:hypothetical protein